jgi:NTE family protein
MPFGSEGIDDALTGLALSGGGFRATLFHLGTLWRLNELGYLPRLDRISSVSGGSITSGVLAVRWAQLQWANGVATNFQDEIVRPLRDFCSLLIDGPAIAEGAILPWKDVSEIIEEEYRTHLFHNITLQDLPDRPRFIFNATNFMTGVVFRFSKPYAGDYLIGLIDRPTFLVALAVTASSAFPPFLSPVIRDVDQTLFHQVPRARLYPQIEYRQRLFLTDGGAYDNLGLETLDKRCKTLLVSDAGAPFIVSDDPSSAWVKQALRAFDVATNQARALRKRELINDYKSGAHRGSYWGITTLIADYQLADSLPVTAASTEYLSSIRTRLDRFSEDEQCRLINGGYALCDTAMRKYVVPGAGPAPHWPYPAFSLDQPIAPQTMAASAEGGYEAP